MKLITPSVEIWEQNNRSPLEDMWEHIARCTRVCYQSIPKEKGESGEDFVKRVILRNEPWNSDKNHLAMLEHGTVYLKFSDDEVKLHPGLASKYANNKYTKSRFNYDHLYWYVTTNLRVLVENNSLGDLKYLCAPTEHHVRRVTVSFITNIGVTREFNRHRVNSMAEESTRYCNYNLDKFDNSITFTLPKWIDKSEIEIQACRDAETESYMYANIRTNMDDLSSRWNTIDWYLYAISTAAYCYKQLIKLGWKPQQAREVLPLATKSQLIHTAFVDDWIHFIKLRAEGVSGIPHPNAKLIAEHLKQKLIKLGYIKEQTI